MSTALMRAISIADAKIWKGGTRVITAVVATAMPTKIEDFMSLDTMALVGPWVDFGATTEDGFTISRTWDDVEGIATDQRDFLIREGSVENVVMTGTATSLYTDVSNLAYLWGVGAVTSIAASMGVNVAQKSIMLGTITDLPPKKVVILQQNNKSGKMRAWVFRQARLAAPGDLQANRVNASRVEFTLNFDPDPAIIDGSDFGLYFEQT